MTVKSVGNSQVVRTDYDVDPIIKNSATEDPLTQSSLTSSSSESSCSFFSTITSCFSTIFGWIASLFCCNCEERDAEGYTPFKRAFLAAFNGTNNDEIKTQLDIAKKCLEQGANVHALFEEPAPFNDALDKAIILGCGLKSWRAFVRFFIPYTKSFEGRERILEELLSRSFVSKVEEMLPYRLAVAILLIQTGVDPNLIKIDNEHLLQAITKSKDLTPGSPWAFFYAFLSSQFVYEEFMDQAFS